MGRRKKEEVPIKSLADQAERELGRQVHVGVRDELVALYDIHARTLEYSNLQSQAYRRALEVIEGYRQEKIAQCQALQERVRANGSPDGTIEWDSVQGYHLADR